MSSVEQLGGLSVIVQGKTIVDLKRWVVWNGAPWLTDHLLREGDLFVLEVSTPEGGGPPFRGTLEEVLSGAYHPDVQKEYRTIMLLEDPSPEKIRAAGFSRADILIRS